MLITVFTTNSSNLLAAHPAIIVTFRAPVMPRTPRVIEARPVFMPVYQGLRGKAG